MPDHRNADSTPPRTWSNWKRLAVWACLISWARLASWARMGGAVGALERDVLAALALSALLAVGFIRIAAYVAGETPGEFDVHIITALRNPANLADPLGPAWFEEAMRDITALGGTIVLIIVSLSAFGFLIMTGKRHSAYMLAVSVIGAIVISQTLKLGFSRARPDLVPHGARIYTMSFPSGHAMMSAAVYLTLAALLARTRAEKRVKVFIIAVAAAVTLAIGVSRVYLGVHWPTDVAAGWAGGAAWAIFCWSIMIWLQQRGKIEREHEGGTPTARTDGPPAHS